jgi:hypothetical protein
MLKYAQEIGWEYVKPADALGLREGDTGLYFSGILEAQLVRLNPGVVDLSRTPDILRRLKLLNPTIEGNREAHSWLRDIDASGNYDGCGCSTTPPKSEVEIPRNRRQTIRFSDLNRAVDVVTKAPRGKRKPKNV